MNYNGISKEFPRYWGNNRGNTSKKLLTPVVYTFNNINIANIGKDIAKALALFSKAVGRLFILTLVLISLRHFVPELEEKLPELYKFIDGTLIPTFNGAWGLVNKYIGSPNKTIVGEPSFLQRLLSPLF